MLLGFRTPLLQLEAPTKHPQTLNGTLVSQWPAWCGHCPTNVPQLLLRQDTVEQGPFQSATIANKGQP